MYQPAPQKAYSEPTITVGNETLKVTDRFCYLGSTLSSSANIDAEVENRIAKASSTFGRLRKTVWERRGIKTSTKVKVYRATVIPTLLYACETWTLYERHTRKLQRFHMNCLRRILGISWQEKIPDTEVLALAEIPSMQALLKKTQLRWAGHVARMPDERLPKRLFFGELAKGITQPWRPEEEVQGHSQGILEADAPEPINLGNRSAATICLALHYPQRHQDI